jgi:hypothetical protein
MGCQYAPCAEYFAHWLHHGHITLEAHEHYQKRTWRNRTAIVASTDPLHLTIPLVKGKHQQMPVRAVQIAYDDPWMQLHINSLQSQYGKSAFANEVLPGFSDLLRIEHTTLWSLNIALLEYLSSLLPGDWRFSESESYIKSYSQSIHDLRHGVAAGISSIAVDCPTYPQVQRIGQPFQANLSILDVLCHLGPQTFDYLSRYAAKLYSGT